MNKSALIILLSATMLVSSPAIETTPSMQGKGMSQGKSMVQGKHKKMMKRFRMSSPFLIKHGLPHMTKLVMRYMNDDNFALTAEQKKSLAKVKEETMVSIAKIKPEIATLRKSIVDESTSGKPASGLQEKVKKLASLEAEATMIHLKCIEDTKSILTKDQLLYLLANTNKSMRNKRSMRGGNRMGMKQN